MSFIRYPGGKSKFKQQILAKFSDYAEYREPFFGGGSIGLDVLKNKKGLKKFWINDLDYGMFALWTSVKDHPEELISKVNALIPSVEKFDEFKANLLSGSSDIVETGFQKLAIHQMSFSGLGLKSGGPLGGRNQNENTKYPISCRWSPDYISKKIRFYNNLMSKTKTVITNIDFMDMIADPGKDVLLYLDPPYYAKGGDLYLHAFDDNDHNRMKEILKNSKHDWVLSYDDCPEIRSLYSWAYVEEFSGNYSIKQLKNEDDENSVTVKTELLIMKDQKVSELIQFPY